ncbi:hypothetical protein AHAS_Ahas12G0210800 [Arachis hypogaea]
MTITQEQNNLIPASLDSKNTPENHPRCNTYEPQSTHETTMNTPQDAHLEQEIVPETIQGDEIMEEVMEPDPKPPDLNSIETEILFVAGVDSTSITIEWAMAELLRNPEKLEKLRKELHCVLGKGEQNLEQIEESHISKLPFLRAVVKETWRLHPPAPLLAPHKALEDVEITGFMIPKNAQILVNVWAMGKDSSIWEHPNEFMPERFLDSKIDIHGHDFELIPFGAGRRICPGLPLGYRSVHIALATLLNGYDWKLANGQKSKDLDMSEKFGLTLHKAQPLQAIPIKSQ